MKYHSILMFLIALGLLASCQKPASDSTNSVSVRWEVESIAVDPESETSVRMIITNHLNTDLTRENWFIQFSQIGGRLKGTANPDQFSLSNKNGDLFELRPNENFEVLSSGASREFQYKTHGWINKFSQVPKGMFLVLNGKAQSIDLDTPELSDEVLSEANPTTAFTRFHKNDRLSIVNEEELPPIIPAPKNFTYTDETKEIGSYLTFQSSEGLESEVNHLKSALDKLGIELRASNQNAEVTLVLKNDASFPHEGYQLRIDKGGINIGGSSAEGIYYGIQSLVQYLMIAKNNSSDSRIGVRGVIIEDAPRFAYRGMHLDVSRNFHRKETILKMLDALAFYKINKFHFHLTDDEGWRLEIPGLPELTTIGSNRGYSEDESEFLMPSFGSGHNEGDSYGSGFYTREDFIEIIQYARDRHIEVIPEIDVPGHARAAIVAMKARAKRLMAAGKLAEAEEYMLHDPDDESIYSSAQNWHDNVICVCRDGAYNFTEKVFEEIIGMFREAQVPLKSIHVGGDEQPYGAWQKSPLCSEFVKNNGLASTDDLPAFFFDKLKDIMDRYGLVTSGWEEMMIQTNNKGHEATAINPDFLGQNMRAYVWNAIIGGGRDDMVYKLANAGYQVVMCNSSAFYFDMAYDRDPDEIGLSWSGYSDSEKIFRTEPMDLFGFDPIKDNGESLSDEYVRSREGITSKGRQNFLGIQAQLWSETLLDDLSLEYLFMPKLLSFTTRAWGQRGGWINARSNDQGNIYVSEWNQMANMIGQKGMPVVDKLSGGFQYRIPEPGAIIENGQCQANVAFPGLEIQYKLSRQEGDPKLYDGPIQMKKGESITLWTVNAQGRMSRPTVLTAK